MLKEEMKGLMIRYPKLCSDGIGVGWPGQLTTSERSRRFLISRVRLSESLMFPALARWWMIEKPKTKSIETSALVDRRPDSMNLVNLLFDQTGVQLTAGEFIVGAILAGFSIRNLKWDQPHVAFNVSLKSIPGICDFRHYQKRERSANLRAIVERHQDSDPEAAAYLLANLA